MNCRQKIEQLTSSYVEANSRSKANPTFRDKAKELFVQMEQAIAIDPEATEPVELQWCREWRSVSKDYLENFYGQFGVQFDEWHCESEQVAEGNRVTDDLIERGIAVKTADDFWCISREYSGDRSVLRKSDTGSLYLTRDMGAIFNRHRMFNADEYAYVVERLQQRHFIQMKQILTCMGDPEQLAEKINHIFFGRVIGLSTRTGKNDSVDFLLEQGMKEAREHVLASETARLTDGNDEEFNTMCKQLSKSALVYDIMRRHRATEYTFSFKGAFNPDQNSAFLLQDKHARLNSLLLNNQELMNKIYFTDNYGRYSLNASGIHIAPIQNLVRLIFEFDTVVMGTLETLEGCELINYLNRLAVQAGKSISMLKVRGEVEPKAMPRLLLLADGMRILGIEPLDKI